MLRDKIKEAMEKKGWRVYRLAQETEDLGSPVASTLIYRWFNHEHCTMSNRNIDTLCHVLNLELRPVRRAKK